MGLSDMAGGLEHHWLSLFWKDQSQSSMDGKVWISALAALYLLPFLQYSSSTLLSPPFMIEGP